MRKFGSLLLPALLLAFGSIGATVAAEPTSTPQRPAFPAPAASADISVLTGAWVRPDGGYTILIRSVGANGHLEAMYFNPNPLPFAKAEVSREGAKLSAYFELRAGGYNGSTYELSYDPASDRLTGTYYQAVMKQKFEVFFVRRS